MASLQAQDLKSALAACSHVAIRHTGVPALKSVRLMIGNGLARFEATNNDQSVVMEVAAEGELEAYLDTQMLADRAQVLDRGVLILSQAQGMVTLAQGKAKWRVPSVTVSSWPAALFEQLAGDEKVLSGGEFMRQLDAVSYAMEPEGSDRHVIAGVYVDDEGWLVATDEKRFSIVPTTLGGNFTIPANSIGVLRKLFKDAGEVAVRHDERWLEFSSDGLTFRTKLMEHKYPNWRKAEPQGEGSGGLVSSPILEGAVKRVGAISADGKRMPRVHMQASGKSLKITATVNGEENSDEIEWKGDEVDFHINPRFVLDTLNSLDGDVVEIMAHESGHVVFSEPDKRGFRIVMSLRG